MDFQQHKALSPMHETERLIILVKCGNARKLPHQMQLNRIFQSCTRRGTTISVQ